MKVIKFDITKMQNFKEDVFKLSYQNWLKQGKLNYKKLIDRGFLEVAIDPSTKMPYPFETKTSDNFVYKGQVHGGYFCGIGQMIL